MGYINPAEAIPTKQSSDGDWIAWYESLPGDKASKNLILSMVWNKRGASKANTSALRTFLQTKGFTLGADNILGTAKDASLGVLDKVGSVLKIGQTAIIVVGGFTFLFMGAIIWRVATPAGIGTAAGTAAKVYSGKP